MTIKVDAQQQTKMRLSSSPLPSINKKTFKIVVLGEKHCGKTALTVRYLTGKFIYDYATGEDFIYPHQANLNNGDVQINIVDTSQNTVTSAIVDADGVIIVYAINSKSSFHRAEELLKHVVAVSCKPSIAIAANKSDMWHYRTVMRSDGEYLAKQYGCKYFELSALTDYEKVQRMFNVMLKLMNDRHTDKELIESKSAIVINDSSPPPIEDFEGRRRARSLHLPKENKAVKVGQSKSPILFRKLIRSWNQSSLSRSKSTEKLF
ncbi:ras-related and estrogen-regulated growth inhibitor-like protein [Clytia hemisphaerica]|uniref:small monomeric GTPase n=1 Tax=Clytia hemisphaerica TaxID=252671 RepID=A0A7M5VDN1_9CNID